MGRKQRREAARTQADDGVGGGTALAERPTGTSPETAPGTGATERPERPGGRLARLRGWWPVVLLRAAHPRQALLTALALGAAAALLGREVREVAVVTATVLVGQIVAGWHHDLVDRERDRRHQAARKPLAGDETDPGTVWFAVACGVLLVVPLAISVGVVAGAAYLAALLVTLLGNVLLRRGLLSWLPWAVSFGLYPAYLTYGGWGGDALGDPPSVLVTVLAAALGVAVHLARSAPGLVLDHEEGWRTLPVRLALRVGAGRVLLLGVLAAAVLLAAILAVGAQGGTTVG